MGAALYSPTLPSRLVEQGWGPVRLRAGEGYSTGQFAVEQSFRSSYWITLWRSQGWDPPNVIVNLGANDSGFCDVDLACARAAIMHLVDTIGPGHKIWWPQITRLYTHRGQQDNWNLALQQIADERADFYTWDWPTVMETGPFPSSDGTHLAPDGYRRRSQLMAEVFTDDIAVATHVGGRRAAPAAARVRERIRAAGPEADRRHPQRSAGATRGRRHAHGRSRRRRPRRDDRGRRQPDGDPTRRRRLPHRPPVRSSAARRVERQLPRRGRPWRDGRDPTLGRRKAVRVLRRRQPCDRRPPGCVRARPRYGIVDRVPAARHAVAARRHAQHRSGVDPHDPGAGRCRRGRRQPDRHRSRHVGLPHRLPVRRRRARTSPT